MQNNTETDTTPAGQNVTDTDFRIGFEESMDTIEQSLSDLWHDFIAHLPQIIAAVLVLFATWAIAKLATFTARRLLSKARLRTSLRDLFRQLINLGVWVVGLTVAAIVVFPNMTPTKVFAALGVGSVAIGFAFKDIFENFFAGVLILWRFPFDPGDFIECGKISGKVEDITIRMTMIRRTTGELTVVPNAMLFKEPVEVWTDKDRRRITVICGVGYGEDVDAARQVIRDAAAACETVLDDEDVEIFAQEFGASSVNYEVTWWSRPTPLEIRRSRDEVVAAVKRALDDAGIEIPFPYRTLTFKEPLEMSAAGSPNRDASEPA